MQDGCLGLSSPEAHWSCLRPTGPLGTFLAPVLTTLPTSAGEEDALSSAGLPTRAGAMEGRPGSLTPHRPPSFSRGILHPTRSSPPPAFPPSLPKTHPSNVLPFVPTNVLTPSSAMEVSAVCPAVQGSGGHEVQP